MAARTVARATDPPGEDEPTILRIKSSGSDAEQQRKPLFYIDDDEYTVPVRVGPNVGLKYLRILRTRGEEVGAAFMLETLLGTEGYEALMEYDELTDDQLTQIIEDASKIMMAAVETPKGSSRSGRNKSRGS
jgi:hypothetical protein